MHRLEAKTYVNSDSTKVVPEGSPAAAFLLGLAGDEISDETAKRLGLVGGAALVDVTSPGAPSKAELLDQAATLGLELPSKATKSEIAEAIVAKIEAGTADQGEAEATDGTKQAEKPAEA